MESYEWVVAYIGSDEITVKMLKDNLESAGIETIIVNKSDSNFPAPGDLKSIYIIVKQLDSELARAIINDILENDNGETDGSFE